MAEAVESLVQKFGWFLIGAVAMLAILATGIASEPLRTPEVTLAIDRRWAGPVGDDDLDATLRVVRRAYCAEAGDIRLRATVNVTVRNDGPAVTIVRGAQDVSLFYAVRYRAAGRFLGDSWSTVGGRRSPNSIEWRVTEGDLLLLPTGASFTFDTVLDLPVGSSRVNPLVTKELGLSVVRNTYTLPEEYDVIVATSVGLNTLTAAENGIARRLALAAPIREYPVKVRTMHLHIQKPNIAVVACDDLRW